MTTQKTAAKKTTFAGEKDNDFIVFGHKTRASLIFHLIVIVVCGRVAFTEHHRWVLT